MSVGIGTVKDKFLSDIIGIDSYRVEYPGLYNYYSVNYKEKNRFEYVRLVPERMNFVNGLFMAGFKIVCQELEFKKDATSFYEDFYFNSWIVDTYYPLIPDSLKIHFSEKFAKTFKYDRFFKDKDTKPYAFEIKKQWINNIFSGKNRDLLLFAIGNKQAELGGFLSVKKIKDRQCRIDLISVLEEYQGKGIASQLIQELCLCEDIDEIIVNTQADNYPAISLYKKLGFQINQIYTVLHRFNKGLDNG